MEALKELGIEVVLFVLGGLGLFLWSLTKKKFSEFVDTITDEKRFGKAAGFANDAVELIESRFKDIDGEEKFEEALGMLSRRLDRNGIDLDEETARMMIQKGWRAMEGKQKGELVDIGEEIFEEGDDEDFSFGEDIDDEEMQEITKEEEERDKEGED